MNLNEKGFSLLSTIIILITCAVFLLGGLWMISLQSIEISQSSGASEASFYAAEGAMAQTMAFLKNNPSWPPINPPDFGDDPVYWRDTTIFNGINIEREVSVTRDSSGQLVYTVSVRSQAKNTPRKLLATVTRQQESRPILDIVLALDISGSMGYNNDTVQGYDCCTDTANYPNPVVRGGNGYCCSSTSYSASSCQLAFTRLDCAKEAITLLVDNSTFSLEHDFFSLISYGTRAEVYAPLNNDYKGEGSTLRLSLSNAIDDAKTLGYSYIRGTNISDALEKSNNQLLLYGREDSLKIIILLTDGQPTVAPSSINDTPKTVNPPYKYNASSQCTGNSPFTVKLPCESILSAKSGFNLDTILSGCSSYIRNNNFTDGGKCVNLNWVSGEVGEGAGNAPCYCVASYHSSLTADRIKQSFTQPIIYTVGLGADVNSDLLKYIAASNDHYFFVSNAGELSKAFESVARHIEAMFKFSLLEVIPE